MSDVKDMPEDLIWLAINTEPKQFGQMSVKKNPDMHKGYQWSDLRRTGDGWYFYKEVEAARKKLATDAGISDPEEEECIKLAEARINSADKYSKYYKDVRHLDSVDVYRVLSLFDCDRHGHAIGHAAKKLLLSGERTGRKSVEDDVREAVDTLKRWLEMREEDK
jgi:hypothetical protein